MVAEVVAVAVSAEVQDESLVAGEGGAAAAPDAEGVAETPAMTVSEASAGGANVHDLFPEDQGAGAAPVADEALSDEDLNEIADDDRLESIVESLLFAADRPLGVVDLKRLCGERDGRRLTEAIGRLAERRKPTGIIVVSAAGGWRLQTSVANAPWVSKLLTGKPVRLSRALMETLAIIAYKQPITRPEIDDIRGVDCGPVLRTLLDRSLVRVIGKKEEVGRPMLYGTSPEFLRIFNLKDLTELPTLREFHELGVEEQAKVSAAQAASADATAKVEAPNPFAAGTGPVMADREEDEGLLAELDRASEAAERALKPEAPPTAEPAS